ncbi:hypothetical protein QVD17_34537 [Tagetes erecta]|uniref:SWIM-type domain-containing protein n=1 Tax=Tagetes erecta TaxID=13708 RepID=A0AAD8JYL8_TARER|nr:hypothetical protein QVD17_34537 [Tagetes erecta]
MASPLMATNLSSKFDALNSPIVMNNTTNIEDSNSPLSPINVFAHNLNDYIEVEVNNEHIINDVPIQEEEDIVVSISPNGTKLYTRKVAEHLIPVKGSRFKSFEDGLQTFKSYAEKVGFSVRKGQTKWWKDAITHKYLRCNKAGNPQPKHKFDTLDKGSLKQKRRSRFTTCDCKVHILLNFDEAQNEWVVVTFDEYHNHPLVSSINKDLNKISRKLPFSTKQYIHNMSINSVGPVKAHRLLVSLMGGVHNVRGTVTDFKNFSQSIRIFIGDRDSQMILERLRERLESLPNFFFDFVVQNGKLRSVFWADEISKLNYEAFGDVLAFDATYQTNKYDMVFVPFTGVDNNKNCVTFGAGLIFDETTESFIWLLECFITAHKKQPVLVLTDQDAAMRQAILEVLPASRHRLCMWHIMKKLPVKISGELLQNTNIRKLLHRLVWNLFISPATFESRWQDLIEMFSLQDHEWLSEMYAIRHRWVPAYFRELPLCCLMKTTSRCESSNSSFKVNSSSANTLVQFMLCYDARLESQRYRQRLAQFKTSDTSFVGITNLVIEKHAFDLYSHTIFLEVQKEITKGLFCCYIANKELVDGVHVYHVSHLDRRNDLTNTFQVKFESETLSTSCSCRGFTRLGYLCRHIFAVYRVNKIEKIPELYISKRWLRNVLPSSIYSLHSRYGVDNQPQSVLRTEILDLMTECCDVLRGDIEGLSTFANQLKDMRRELIKKGYREPEGKDAACSVIEELVGQPIVSEISVANPEGIRNKGTGKRGRIHAPAEKKSKKPRRVRLCHTCNKYVDDHDSRNCKKITAQAQEQENAGP